MLEPSGLLRYSLRIIITLSILTSISANSTNLCQIYDPKLDYEFDLRNLIPDDSDMIVIPEITLYNDIIRLQLCSPLIEKCNDEDGFAICVRYENGRERGIGKFPPQVSAKRGEISFTFSDIICDNDSDGGNRSSNYVIIIYLQCDYQATITSHPTLDYFNRHSCRTYLTWKTALACGPRTQKDCTVVNNKEHYDLTALIQYSKNYRVNAPNKPSSWLTFNVCHSVIRKPNAVCSSNVGVCVYDKEHKKFINLGIVEKPPIVKNGHVLLEYRNGDLCISNVATLENYRTTVIFICTPEHTNTVSRYAEKIGKCHFQIIWNTPMGCSIETLLRRNAYQSNCIIQNPITKFTYNLRSLMKNDHIIEYHGKRYKLSICRPLIDKRCTAGTGMCDVKTGISYGEANDKLLWQPVKKAPYLLYINGDNCPAHGWSSHTVIIFFCGHEVSYPPIVLEKTECDIFIHWGTDLVCEKEILCNVDYFANDLSALIRRKDNYFIKHGDLIFHINVCIPLVFIPGVTCERGVAACAIRLGLKDKHMQTINLGYPLRNPILNEKQHTVLRYIGGTQCQEDSNKQLSTNITFICSNKQQKSPAFKDYVNCTYLFEWNTKFACITTVGVWVPPCSVRNRFRDLQYDLSILYENKKMYYVEGRQSKKYSINICNNENFCNGPAVCDGTNSYGSFSKILCDHKVEGITLEYLDGSKCNNSFYTSKIRLICNESVGIGTPKLLIELQCSVEFEWQTEVVCMKSAHLGTVTEISQDDLDKQSPTEILVQESSSHNDVICTVMTIMAIVLCIIIIIILAIYYRKRIRFCDYLYNYVRTFIEHRIRHRHTYIVTYTVPREST